MTTPVIIDIVVVAILVGFALFGASRGLFRALSGLAVFLVALIGAGLIASAAAAPAARVVAPVISGRIEERVSEALAAHTGQVQMPEAEGSFSADELLGWLGLDSDVRDALADQAQETIRETGATLAAAVVESVAQSIIYAVLYVVSFAVLTLALKLLVRFVDLVLKLPVLHGLNAVGGAAAGLAEGALLLFLAIWAARRFGVSFDTETVAATHVLRFFTTNTPLSALSFFA